ncbi:MAG: hypothetical protein L0241_09210 [Planctomycetia bacterium]|nr:hypothetical protein [Planctomycetia bacterium]
MPVLQPAAPQLPITTRTGIEPDVSLFPKEPSGVPFRRPAEYRRLTADECRRFAIANAPFADDLDQHPENNPPSHPKLHKNAVERAETSRLVRGHAADELRNRAAGEALEDFYKLAEAEGQFDLLVSAETELRQQLEDALKAEKAGLKDRADIPALRRRLLDLEAQQAKLEAGIGALNASLRARLGLPGNDTLPLWPADPLRVKPDDVDIERAVVTGLQYRPDLNLLRVLSADGAGDLADAVLTSLNPLLGKLEPENLLRLLLAPLMRDPKRHQASDTERVARALAARERQADAEIRAAAVLLRGHRSAIAARTLEVKQVEAKIEELLIKQKAGLNVTAELATAKLDLYKAKADLLSAVIEWHLTEVKLRQAMGLLVRSHE